MEFRMRILAVQMKYDYGDPRRGPNEGIKYGLVAALKKNGCDVSDFFYDEHFNNIPLLQTELLRAAENYRPDLIFIDFFRDQIHTETLDQLKAKFRTIAWFGDDTWRFETYSSKLAPHLHSVITTDPFSVAKYKKIGVDKVFLSQWAATNLAIPTPSSYKFEVSFVGQKNPSREWFINKLKKRGIAVQCFGYGWPSGMLKMSEMVDVFNESKINLNLSNSTNNNLDYIFYSWRSLKEYLRSGKNMSQIKARNFEINYFGGFQLTDYVPFIEKYYRIGEEIVCYSNADEAAELIRFYLDNETEREAIRIKGIERARNQHSFLNRASELIGWLERT
jgi:spore maturation protein CgeB